MIKKRLIALASTVTVLASLSVGFMTTANAANSLIFTFDAAASTETSRVINITYPANTAVYTANIRLKFDTEEISLTKDDVYIEILGVARTGNDYNVTTTGLINANASGGGESLGSSSAGVFGKVVITVPAGTGDLTIKTVPSYCYYATGTASSTRVKNDSEVTVVASAPAQATATPTVAPPTAAPTAEPTAAPTAEPTAEPTLAPTAEPTLAPTAEPTLAPTAEPTLAPTAEPTAAPTAEPTAAPTAEPTAEPTPAPTQVAEKTNKGFEFSAIKVQNVASKEVWKLKVKAHKGDNYQEREIANIKEKFPTFTAENADFTIAVILANVPSDVTVDEVSLKFE